ncbi:response regulator [Devosia sediminis]|uniref:Response regulator n=1 Tax=Devosia sediminis TaxID=2798801 RepID=A0A934INM6_9HYPH|nr:response regulator [Devosia sediminis]MBJ3784013.1 response regulator [Devosia sediminis]
MPDTQTILLVEDEFLLLALMEDLLSERFSVISAPRGDDAIDMLNAEPGREIHGLVTDIRMPGVFGWDVAKRARELHPDIAVIYLTGDSLADWRTQAVPGSKIFGKPAKMDELIEALTKLMIKTV